MKNFKIYFRNYCEPVAINELARAMVDCFFEEKSFRKEACELLRPPKGFTYEVVQDMDDLLYLVEQIVSPDNTKINTSDKYFKNAVAYYESYCGYSVSTLPKIFGGMETLKKICYDLAQKIIADPRAAGWK